MYELLRQLLFHLHGMWNYRWYALVAAWVVSTVIWVFVYTLPDEYRATARVYIDTESVLKPLLSGLAVETNVMTEVSMVKNTLLSRPNLEKVARETDLDLRATTPAEMNELIIRLEKRISIAEGRGKLFTISFTDVDREMGGKVVQNLLNSLVEDTLGASRTDTTLAQRFLREQIEDYEKRLSEAEQRLAQFKKEHVGMMPQEGRDYYSNLQISMEALERTKSDLKAANSRVNELRRQLDGDMPAFFGFSEGSVSSEDEKRIAEYKAQLNRLLLNYTEKHPEVVILNEVIAELEEQRIAKRQSLGGVNTNLQANPVYERMRISLNEAEVEIAILKTKRVDQQRKVDALRKLVDTIPEVEAQLTRLNRDYEVTKGQYESLVHRLESAHLSEEAEQSKDDIEFRVIDPVNVQLRPIGPKRTLLLIGGIIAGLSAGLGLALLLEQSRPVFNDRDKLGESLSLPVWGAISMVFTPAQKVRLRVEVISFLMGTGMLVIAGGGVILFQKGGVRIMQSLMNAM